MTVEELQRRYNFCVAHRRDERNPGIYGGCLHCENVRMNKALSEIASLVARQPYTDYDVSADPDSVVEDVKRYIEVHHEY